MKKILVSFFLLLFLFSNAICQNKEKPEPILILQYIPSYVSMKMAYELKSPYMKIYEDRTIFFNDEGTARQGQLSKKELDLFVAELSDLRLFELTMDTLRASALNIPYVDGTIVKLFYTLNNKRDSLTMGMVNLLPDSIRKTALDDQDIPWYKKLEEKVGKIQDYLHNFRPKESQTFKGVLSAVFLDCKKVQFGCTGSFVSTGADSFYVESVSESKKGQPWPIKNLNPVFSDVNSFEKAKEVIIENSKVLEEINLKGVRSGRIYKYKGKTFAVYLRPLFKYQ